MKDITIGVIGLGYVGLPLAIEFGKKYTTIGFDINEKRIYELQNFKDITLEIEVKEFRESLYFTCTRNIQEITNCNFYIITVPTPIDSNKKPDLSFLIDACKSVGGILKEGDIVIFESTVYPGATEEVCVPILEQYSKLIFNQNFYCGYSPERINPGDKEHRIKSIKKVTSGSTPEIADLIDELYQEIITAGTHKAPSIKVAEAAKVIENTQRDLNIALMNELSLIFNRLNIDTEAVLEAAATKWNFLPFTPGLVGGHCISVDPYYLTHKAIEVGYYPEIILSGRSLNDNMGAYIVDEVIKLMLEKSINMTNPNILIMGFTFKENCPDLRNTRVVDLIEGFKSNNFNVDVYDPWVNKKEIIDKYGFETVIKPFEGKYDAILLAVAHDEFKELTLDNLKIFRKKSSVLYDVKYLFRADQVDGRL